jgi:predicted ATPase/DNA-binding CsgD family transcriptional regulator
LQAARVEGSVGAERRANADRRLPAFDEDGIARVALTRRELAVLELVAGGDTNAQVARRLSISPLTVKKHLERMYAATGSNNRAELIGFAWRRAASNGGPLSPQRPGLMGDLLPAALTSFVGREAEIAEVSALVFRSRLVTLGGPGGIGKSRLAVEVARRNAPSYADGVRLVELADLSDPRLVPQRLAGALGLQETRAPRVPALAAHLRRMQLLLVLDNCEHLISACADILRRILPACPALRVLATSREVLGVAGEAFWSVPPLSTPEGPLVGSDLRVAAQRSEAVRLFMERAPVRSPAPAHQQSDIGTIARICRSLDGMPLAIELAAARLNVLSVDELAARLNDRFRELRTDAREVLPRHRTLRGVLEWSYQLLTPPEALLFQRLAVFAGGCTLEAAEKVCGGEGIVASDVVSLMARLVEKSFVIADGRKAQTRYRYLETVQHYGREKLEASGTTGDLRQLHGHYFRDLAEAAESHLHGIGQEIWFERLDAEQDNIRAALRWSIDCDPDAALRMTSALWRYWFHRGMAEEGSRWADEAMSIARGAASSIALARAVNAGGSLQVALAQFDAAERRYEGALTLAREAGDNVTVMRAVSNLAMLARGRRDHERSSALYREALALAEQLEDPWSVALAMSGLGEIAFEQGDRASAATYYKSALRWMRRTGDRMRAAHFMRLLADLARSEGRRDRAASLYRRALVVFRGLGDRVGQADMLERLGVDLYGRGRVQEAARLLGAGAAIRRAVGQSLEDARGKEVVEIALTVDAGLTSEERAALEVDGGGTAVEEAIDLALQRRG